MRPVTIVLAAMVLASALAGAARASHWPHATYTSPPVGGENVPVSTNFEIVWSEAMDYSSVEDSFRFVDVDRSITYDSSDGAWIHGLGTPTSTFDPSFNLPTGTRFLIVVCSPAGAISVCPGAVSGSGEPLDENQNHSPDGPPSDDLRVDFTTAGSGPSDTVAPQVTFSVPSTGQQGFPVDGGILVTFSERMDRGSVEAGLSITDGTATRTASDGVVTWSTDGSGRDVLQWNLAIDLVANMTYSLQLGAPAQDLSGNLLDGDGNGSPGGTFTATFKTAPTSAGTPPPPQPPSPWPIVLAGGIIAAILLGAFLLLWVRRRRQAGPPAIPPPSL